jgi:prepilin-type processing-associated H-X9-DG protein
MVLRSRASRRAYTLAEVLVVVGVIALLVGLLLPVVSRARGAAARVRCAATLRQYGLANQMYVSEYRDWWLPVKWGYNPNPTPPAQLPAGLAPATIGHQTYPNNPAFRKYLRARDAGTGRVPAGMVCPRAVLAEEGGTKAGYNLGRSYGYNSTGLSWYAGPTIYYTGWKRRQVRSPATKLMFVDATDWVVSLAGSGRWDLYGEAHGVSPRNGITAYRHERGANVAYWDGHVAWVGKGEVAGNAGLWRVGK